MREVKFILPDGSEKIMWKSSLTFGGEPFRVPNVGEFVLVPQGHTFHESRKHDTFTVSSIATRYESAMSDEYTYNVEVVLK